MRYFLLYFSWLGVWATSEAARYSYEQGVPLAGNIWVEAARFMIFFSIASFAFLAADRRKKTISYQVQLEHVVFIIGAKTLQHFFVFMNEMGFVNSISPYVFNIANYLLLALYVIITPIRILYIKKEKR